MARNYLRNDSWREDADLKTNIRMYVSQGMQRKEMVDFLKRDYPQYGWSIPSLDRRMRHFNIYYTNQTVPLKELKRVLKEEINGPGGLLGYRAMHKKVRQKHGLNVPRDLVYAVMMELDPNGLQERRLFAKKKKTKGCFFSKGPNWVHSLDGHDKLMGFQNHTFPLAIYGCLDSCCSRKLLWLKIWTSNKNPKLIGRWYAEYLLETKQMSTHLRLDKGTETTIMATMHAFLHRHHNDLELNPEDTVLYGPSTSNQIERWWRKLHERLEKYFKHHLCYLKEEGFYNSNEATDRSILAFVMIPLVQQELTIFKDIIWNTHRIRSQKCTILPCGVPNHMYCFPERYGLEECGWPVTEDDIQEAVQESGILDFEEDYLEAEFRASCERLIPEQIKADECADAFIFLKRNLAV